MGPARMMARDLTIPEAITAFRERGVRFRVANNRKLFIAEKPLLEDRDLLFLHENKAEVIAFLEEEREGIDRERLVVALFEEASRPSEDVVVPEPVEQVESVESEYEGPCTVPLL